MHKYDIRDVWMALKLSSKNFLILLILIWIISPFILTFFNITKETGSLMPKINIYLTFAALIQSFFIYFANVKYIIDTKKGFITIPKSDIENSILEIILLFRYWNLMRRITIECNEIENIFIDTKRWSTKNKIYTGTTNAGKSKYRTETKNHIRYTINITGIFGSANLSFLDRQKRDEVRNAIQQCVHYHTGKNIDKKIAEFN